MDGKLAESIAEVEELRERGDLLQAFDRASEHLKTWPDAEGLKHAGLLALARAGATVHATRLFADWALHNSANPDVLALEARLAKDSALRREGAARKAGLLDAAGIYRRIHEGAPSYYTAINWASLSFLGGAHDEAGRLAEGVLADPAVSGATDYWALATRAEANLVLGRNAAARGDLVAAARTNSGTGARSSTRRQLALILAEAGHAAKDIDALLAPLAAPVTVHFSSTSLPGENWPPYVAGSAEAPTRERIRTTLEKLRPGSAFGSVGTAPEIIFAEECLAVGAQLEVVIPVPESVLKSLILAKAGPAWAERFEACCRNARRVVLPSDDPEATDTSYASYAVRVGMGLALLRAQHIGGKAIQVVLRDEPQEDAPGLAAEAAWISHHRQRVVIGLDDIVGTPGHLTEADIRPTRALIFGDVLGFSELQESQLPVFWDTVMRVIGDVIAANVESVALKNTWGDAVHLVISDVRNAARICLAVQKGLAAIDGHLFGRDLPPAMRIGAHYGPVFTGWDHVAGQSTYYGRALSKAARIEPITPPGTVYVTEAFAAILLLETGQEFTCTYVGLVPLAKGFGSFRMYDLVAS